MKRDASENHPTWDKKMKNINTEADGTNSQDLQVSPIIEDSWTDPFLRTNFTVHELAVARNVRYESRPIE